MVRLLARVAAGLVIAPYFVLAADLAPEHLHESDGDHSHAIVHSHFEPHDMESLQHDGSEIDHAQDRVVWLDSPIIHQLCYQFDPSVALVAAALTGIPIATRWSVHRFDEATPAHGPPRDPSSLRGPPPSRLA